MKKEQIFIGNIKKCTEYEMVATTSVGIIINGIIYFTIASNFGGKYENVWGRG